MDFDDQKELVKDYIEDAWEFIDDLEQLLLRLEDQAGAELDRSLVSEVLGILHTFKGNSGMMGYSGLQKYSHKLEDIFKALQAGEIRFDEELTEVFNHASNVIRNSVSKISPDEPDGPSLAPEIEAIERFLSEAASEEGTAGTAVFADSPTAVAGNRSNVLKVDFERLDHLLNLMGELVIYRTRLGQIDSRFKEQQGEKGLTQELSDTNDQIGKVTTELHEAIMRVRMLPIRQVFMRFPRYVRDFAREKGKEINIMFEGEETELDKTVIDEIGEPLLHLIRNAIDHGIEGPEERRKKGKEREGNILIKAFQESSHIIITVEDDGKGIDEKLLREKAESAGFVSGEDAERKSVADLIFASGLSTAEKITEISGRGVGLDVVKKSLAGINGSVEVQSDPDFGTRFIIKLPLTLAIISALMVEVSDEQYAIPLSSVVESIRAREEDIHLVNNMEVIQVRDRVLPLARLSRLFGIESPDNQRPYVVIAQSPSGNIALMVDSLLGQQEIVIKALDDYVGDTPGIAGATILGDGRVVLIIDVLELMNRVGAAPETPETMEAINA